MNPRLTSPGRSSPADIQHDWLEDLLRNDARSCASDSNDADFVVAIMGHLDDPISPHLPSRTMSGSVSGEWLLLGFEVLVLGTICISAPAALQVWLNFVQAPLHVSALLHPDLMGFGAGVTMLVLGAIEWARLADEDMTAEIFK
jgi:hypothetical protein